MDVSLVIFDLGNVLYHTDWEKPYLVWSEVSAVPADQLRSRYKMDDTFYQFERGEISSQEYYHHFNKIMGISISFDDFLKGWNSIFQRNPYPEVVSALKRLSNKMNVVAFSNANEIHNEIWPHRFKDELKYFQKIFISSEHGFRKPEEREFHFILKEMDEKPERTLFFDDMPDNVQAARRLGIHGVIVRAPRDITSELDSRGLI